MSARSTGSQRPITPAPPAQNRNCYRAADKKQEATTNRQEAENCRQTTENSGKKIPA